MTYLGGGGCASYITDKCLTSPTNKELGKYQLKKPANLRDETIKVINRYLTERKLQIALKCVKDEKSYS